MSELNKPYKYTTMEYQGLRVLTTEKLAKELGVESISITKNYSRNKARYMEGKHFFLLKTNELREFLTTYQIDVSLNTNKLYLWTEIGCFNHVKSVGTDESWESFQSLVDKYFRQKEALVAIKAIHESEKHLIEHADRQTQLTNSKHINHVNWTVGGLESIKEYNKQSCELHTTKSTGFIKNWHIEKTNKERMIEGKKPIKTAPSAKEIIRQNRPELAACMSLTDALCKHGANLEEVAPLSLACKPIFQKFIELGIIQKKI